MEIILQKAYPNDEVLNCDSKRFAQPGNPAAEFQLLARLKELRDLSMVNTGLSTLAGFPSLPNLIKVTAYAF
jgi:hypothetical protein